HTPDLRNTRVIDVVRELEEDGINVSIYDPWADPTEAREYLNVELLPEPKLSTYDNVILAVNHSKFKDSLDVGKLLKNEKSIVYDLKGALPTDRVDMRL